MDYQNEAVVNPLGNILNMIKQLSFSDYETLRLILQKEGFSVKDELESYLTENRFRDGRRCVYCQGKHIVKNGHSKEGKQRYICRECGKSFVINSNSITAGTHKSFSVWRTYLDCMVNGYSIRKSASICGIHRETSFAWRHKILDALRQMAESVRLSGKVEADETYLPVSYKGNHTKSSSFSMPRDAHKRGGEIHTPGLSNDQVCVMCAINDANVSYAAAGKLGKVSSSCVAKAFEKRFCKDAVLITDHETAYIRFAKEHDIPLIQMETGKRVSNGADIQRINAYHSRLKRFLDRFHGVSTKYLDNYLTWLNLLFEPVQRVSDDRKDLILLYASALEQKILYRDIPQRAPVPQ